MLRFYSKITRCQMSSHMAQIFLSSQTTGKWSIFLDLLEWRKCQGQAGWYGILAIVIGGGLTFAGLSVIPPLPKKYTPLFSLGVGASCGWFVSHRVVTSCHRALNNKVPSEGAVINHSLEKQKSTVPIPETKFGDKGFVKE